MNTKFVGIKEFRQNISEYAKKAGSTRFIIVNHKKPLFEIKAFEKNETLDSLFASIIQAKEDVSRGRVYTQEQMLEMLS